MGRVRVHQHVNPNSPYYRQEPKPVDIESIFAEPDKPLLLDIGCARGRFLLRMAEAEPSWNYLGIEIREPLVEEANRLAKEAGLSNLHYVFGNAMLWLDRLIEAIPSGQLQGVTIQFADPWFKRKHAKRRMVNKEMVESLATRMPPTGRVFIQTDIEALFEEMFALFRADARFTAQKITENPFRIKTEREKAVEDKGMRVYRSMFLISNSFLS